MERATSGLGASSSTARTVSNCHAATGLRRALTSRVSRGSVQLLRPPFISSLVPQRHIACPALASNPGDNASTSKPSIKDAEAKQADQGPALLPDLSHELGESAPKPAGPLFALASGVGIVLLLAGGYMFKDQIKAFLDFFIMMVEDYGQWGYAAYAVVYIVLEVLALPAIPLTMTAGVIFGTTPGTAIVSFASTAAATIAFLIARYLARDRVRAFAYKHPKFKAIDRAIAKDGLKFVTLLRLSPLLPFAASNYLYGLTSVDLGSYVLGSWVGMLPGTYAYVHAGALGRAVLDGGEGSVSIDNWQIALGLGATLLALAFIGNIAKNAVDEVDTSDTPVSAVTATTAEANGTPPPPAQPQKGSSPSA